MGEPTEFKVTGIHSRNALFCIDKRYFIKHGYFF